MKYLHLCRYLLSTVFIWMGLVSHSPTCYAWMEEWDGQGQEESVPRSAGVNLPQGRGARSRRREDGELAAGDLEAVGLEVLDADLLCGGSWTS